MWKQKQLISLVIYLVNSLIIIVNCLQDKSNLSSKNQIDQLNDLSNSLKVKIKVNVEF